MSGTRSFTVLALVSVLLENIEVVVVSDGSQDLIPLQGREQSVYGLKLFDFVEPPMICPETLRRGSCPNAPFPEAARRQQQARIKRPQRYS